jgi:hypothetical protein
VSLTKHRSYYRRGNVLACAWFLIGPSQETLRVIQIHYINKFLCPCSLYFGQVKCLISLWYLIQSSCSVAARSEEPPSNDKRYSLPKYSVLRTLLIQGAKTVSFCSGIQCDVSKQRDKYSLLVF